jgi:putative aldouronate transport system substrate-binding protein
MMKRCFAAILALIIIFSFSFTEAGASLTFAGYEPEALYREWSTNLFFQRMQEKTDIALTFNQLSDIGQWTKEKNVYQAGTELPDVLFKAALTPAETIDLLEKGVLIDLGPLLEEYAPNAWKAIQETPGALEAITLPDGRIGALPFLSSIPTVNYMWVNQSWLTRLKLKAPTNQEELTQVLLAFKEKDPNANGKKDEIPLGFLGPYDIKHLAHLFGIVANDFNLYLDENGQVEYMAKHPQFYAFLEYMRSLYQQGLLDPSGFRTADSLRIVTKEKAAQLYGIILTPSVGYLFPQQWLSDYELLPPFFFQGKQAYRPITSSIQAGTFAITSACANPKLALKWVDYLFTEEGAILAANGLENVDYVFDGDGTWRKTKSSESREFIRTSLITGGSPYPGIDTVDFQVKYSDPSIALVKEQIDLYQNALVMPFAHKALTFSQEQEVEAMQMVLGRFFDEEIARFIIGEKELNQENFSKMLEELNEKGLATFLSFWQNKLH